ncbi:MAG: beta-eliminating lyase-related protein, partial [Flavobacteriaceae bacterium]
NTIKDIRKVCDENSLGFHLDGARLWNALIAKNETTQQYGEVFDTISVCFSKGLGCPIGSILVGDEAIMKNAIRIRKIFGGNMRQAGYLAAAALYALDNNMNRLEEDHQKAKEIGEALSKLSIIKSIEPIETNIVIFELNNDVKESEFVQKLADNNIYAISMGGGKLRLVTHMDYTDAMHEKLLNFLQSFKL